MSPKEKDISEIDLLRDEIDELRRTIEDLSDENRKLIASVVEISSKIAEFIIKQENLYRTLNELVEILKVASEESYQDPLIKKIDELKEYMRRIEIELRKIYTRLVVTGIKIRWERKE